MQNVLESTQITVKAIADQLGVNISKTAVALEAQEAAIFVKKCIEMGAILHQKTNSSKLTVRHVNMVLDSMNISPLLGYSSTSKYTTQTYQAGDNDELIVLDDEKVTLSEVNDRNTAVAPRPVPFSLQWMMIDGIPIDRWNPRLSLVSSSKNFNRPTFSISESNIHSESLESPRLTNKEIIPPLLQDYYNQIIDHYESNNSPFYDEESTSLQNDYLLFAQDSGIKPLLPAFLQFFSYKVMTCLSNKSEMEKVTCYLDGLIDNPSLPINFYVHPILRILMTIILKYDPCNLDEAQNIDSLRQIISDDAMLRQRCATLLNKLIETCISGFPNIRIVISNAMIQTILSSKTTFCAHIGALSAIEQLGNDVIVSIAPSLPTYISFLKRVINHLPSIANNQIQKELLKIVLCKVEQIVTHFKENGMILKEINQLKPQLIDQE